MRAIFTYSDPTNTLDLCHHAQNYGREQGGGKSLHTSPPRSQISGTSAMLPVFPLNTPKKMSSRSPRPILATQLREPVPQVRPGPWRLRGSHPAPTAESRQVIAPARVLRATLTAEAPCASSPLARPPAATCAQQNPSPGTRFGSCCFTHTASCLGSGGAVGQGASVLPGEKSRLGCGSYTFRGREWG